MEVEHLFFGGRRIAYKTGVNFPASSAAIFDLRELTKCMLYFCVSPRPPKKSKVMLRALGTFKVCIDTDACDYTRELYKLCEIDSKLRKIPYCTGKSNLHQQHAGPDTPPSYIPSPKM